MMIRAMLLAAAAAMPLSACMSTMDGETGMSGRSAMSASAAMDMTPEDRMNYVKMAGASDLFEIQSSQLALSRAQRPETRAYAQMLIQHHNQTTNATMAAARASGMMPPPPMLMPMQQRMMAELQRTSGAGFDRVYLTQQSRRMKWRWRCTPIIRRPATPPPCARPPPRPFRSCNSISTRRAACAG
jgi:putative membrane protein